MNTQNEIKKSVVFNSNGIAGEEQESYFSKYKTSFQILDDKSIDNMTLEDLRYLVKSQMKKIKELENEVKTKTQKIKKIENELTEYKRTREKLFLQDYSEINTSPNHSMLKDDTTNRKQSSISILNTSYANRSVDSNPHSTNSYLNQIKMNNNSNSFSTLSLNFHTKAMNRTDIMSYTLKRPELDIEELYDKEMESYLSLAKKEDLKISELDTDTNIHSEINNTNSNLKMITFGKENTNNTSNSLLNAVNKIQMVKSVNQTTKVLSKSMAPVPQSKETPKKNETKTPTASATANIKKVFQTALAPTGKKPTENKLNAGSNNITSVSIPNLIPTPKREILASVDKNKSVTYSDNSGKTKGNESLLSSVKKVTNILQATSALNNNKTTDKVDVKNTNFHTKETTRTSSVVKSDKNFRTKAEEAVKKFASIDKKIKK